MSEYLTTNQVAAILRISRDAARLLMKKTPGVVTLPVLGGTGRRETRRMPRNVLERLILQRK
jgi:hypothetical protein